MNAIFYKPLSKIVLERQKVVDDSYAEAKLNAEKSEAIIKDKQKKIEKTKHDAKKIIADKANEAKDKKTAMTAEAHQKTSAVIDSAKEELQKSKSQAQDVLSENVVDLARQISSKVLGQDVSIDNVDKGLIANLMEEGK